MDKKRACLERMTLLKTLAIVLVVLGHAGCIYAGRWPYTLYMNESTLIKYITEVIYSVHMPLFVVISGYTYNYNREQQNKYSCKKSFIRSKAKRLLVPYLITGLLFMIPLQTVFNVYTDQQSLIERSIRGILLGRSPGHLWYLLMLFNVFVLFRLLEDTINRQSYSKNIFLMVMVAVMSSSIPNVYQIAASCRYLLYFYIGYLLSRHIEQMLTIKLKARWLVLAYFVMFNSRYLMKEAGDLPRIFHVLDSVLAYSTTCLGIACLLVMIFRDNGMFEGIKNKRLYACINRYSFSIYLVHQPIMLVLIVWIKGIAIPAFVAYSLLFIVTMTLAIQIAMMLQRCKDRARLKIKCTQL